MSNAEQSKTPEAPGVDSVMEGDAAAAADSKPAGPQSSASQTQELQDRLLRTQAELENFRKRSRRELEDERRYAALPLLKDLLPVVDNVHRAIDAASKASDSGTLLEGFRMVAQQLNSVLDRQHCKTIKALHEPFDPHLHEAILQQPSADYPENTVLMVTQEGYQLHDRVIRPAQVIVSKKAE